jgi:hypothetical protein
MGSSALNEKPDEDARDGGKGYVPQFSAAGQEIHYRLGTAAPGAAGAEGERGSGLPRAFGGGGPAGLRLRRGGGPQAALRAARFGAEPAPF